MDIQWGWWITQVLRWVFMLTWLLILIALIRMNRKLDRDYAQHELERRTPPDPPQSMGMDFGVGQLWWQLWRIFR